MSSLAESPINQFINTLSLDRDKVEKFGLINTVEEALLQFEQVRRYEVEHYVMPFVIARQAKLPAGAFITTERHRHWHPYIISYGDVSVFNEQDGGVKHIKAFDAPGGHFTSLTEPETRRFIYVREETLWTTFHPCKHGDVEQMVKDNIFPNNNPLIHPYVS